MYTPTASQGLRLLQHAALRGLPGICRNRHLLATLFCHSSPQGLILHFCGGQGTSEVHPRVSHVDADLEASN